MREDLKKRRFIDNFAIELTNTTLPERMRIAEKYYNEFKREQDRRIYLEDYFMKLEREIKELKKVEICYKENLALCEWQEKHINKLATALEKIIKITETVINASNCSNCDGVGYYDGCKDENCGDYAVRKIFEIVNEIGGDNNV